MNRWQRNGIVLAALFLLIGLFVYAPMHGGDSYYSFARMGYYLFLIPMSVIGVIIFGVFFKKQKDKEIELTKAQMIFLYVLLLFSVITVIPPVFEQVRHVFSPIMNLIPECWPPEVCDLN